MHNERSLAVAEGWYSIDGLSQLMLDQLRIQPESGDEDPFFISFPARVVHIPLQAPADLVDKYREVYKKPPDQLWRDRVLELRNKGLFPEDAPNQVPVFSSE